MKLEARRHTIEGCGCDSVARDAERVQVLEGRHLVQVEGARGEGHQQQAAVPVQLHCRHLGAPLHQILLAAQLPLATCERGAAPGSVKRG